MYLLLLAWFLFIISWSCFLVNMLFNFISIDLLVNLVLALITFSLGLTLTRHDFTNLWLNPKALSVGLFSQLILLPLLALIVMFFYKLDPVLSVGFFIIAICPGGVTSNLLSFMLNGNVALSISLTVLNSVITMFTIPLLANIALDYYAMQHTSFRLPFWDTFFAIFLVTILPAVLGIIIRAKFKLIAKKVQPVLRYVLPIMLFSIFAIKIFGDKDTGGVQLTFNEFMEILPATLMLNIVGMITGLIVGSVLLVKFKNRITILIEVGVQNTALALLVTGVLLDQPDMEKPALVYAVFSFFTTFGVAWIFKFAYFKWRKWVKKEVHPSQY